VLPSADFAPPRRVTVTAVAAAVSSPSCSTRGMSRDDAHPNNVPGPFYVLNEWCTLCGVPEWAPELFAFDVGPTSHCWVKRQPETRAELDQMIDVMAGQEFVCIRYAGTDPAIIERLVARDEADIVDALSGEVA
jgi:hypothetical protein